MRHALFSVACVLTLGLAWKFRCLGRHDPYKPYPLSVSRCRRCEQALSDLAEAGLVDGSAYVSRQSGWIQ